MAASGTAATTTPQLTNPVQFIRTWLDENPKGAKGDYEELLKAYTAVALPGSPGMNKMRFAVTRHHWMNNKSGKKNRRRRNKPVSANATASPTTLPKLGENTTEPRARHTSTKGRPAGSLNKSKRHQSTALEEIEAKLDEIVLMAMGSGADELVAAVRKARRIASIRIETLN
jgi:hypothetical protein